jgi:hypothetical protein
MKLLSEDDLNLQGMSEEELVLAWDLWFDLAQATNESDPPYTYGVFVNVRWQDIRGLQAVGGVAAREDVLDLVDRRIIDGFRAQIEEDETIRPEERQPTLINMLQSYYMQ